MKYNEIEWSPNAIWRNGMKSKEIIQTIQTNLKKNHAQSAYQPQAGLISKQIYELHVFPMVPAIFLLVFFSFCKFMKYSQKWTVYVKSMGFLQLSYDYDAFSIFSDGFL